MKTQNASLFAYLRKSTDDKKRQVLSIEAQRREIKLFAEREGLKIVHIFEEKQSAKIPGRPIFTEMMRRIEAGEVTGILVWHPDRLARNPVDANWIMTCLCNGKLTDLKFVSFWFENSAQGRLMLNQAFGYSQYYSEALGEVTKRGLREKVRRGEFPGPAPVGYLNDYRTKKIIMDRERAPIIKQAFERYARGSETLDTTRAFLAEHKMLSENQKLVGRSFIARVLTNPFYYGHFRYSGEIHEGSHEPIITKSLFDQVQDVLRRRARTSPVTKKVPKVFLGLLHCAECGGAVTAEIQKGHTYYRCTKKNRIASWCSQPYVREEALAEELKGALAPFRLSNEWTRQMLSRLDEEELSFDASAQAATVKTDAELGRLTVKLQKLLDSYLDGIIDRETYLSMKDTMLAHKKSLQEQRPGSSQTRMPWLEPMREWVKQAGNAAKTLESGSLHEQRELASKVFGSNLLLDRKKTRGSATEPWSLLLEPSSCSDLVRPTGLEPVTF